MKEGKTSADRRRSLGLSRASVEVLVGISEGRLLAFEIGVQQLDHEELLKVEWVLDRAQEIFEGWTAPRAPNFFDPQVALKLFQQFGERP